MAFVAVHLNRGRNKNMIEAPRSHSVYLRPRRGAAVVTSGLLQALLLARVQLHQHVSVHASTRASMRSVVQ